MVNGSNTTNSPERQVQQDRAAGTAFNIVEPYWRPGVGCNGWFDDWRGDADGIEG
jgi:hypothetical protein